MLPAPLRPNCKVQDRLCDWKGVKISPPTHVGRPWLPMIESKALDATVSDSDRASYGAGLEKFHIFCDVFSIPEAERLPASFEVLHSFILWTTAYDRFTPFPSPPTDPVSESAARRYLSAICAWHRLQAPRVGLSSYTRAKRCR